MKTEEVISRLKQSVNELMTSYSDVYARNKTLEEQVAALQKQLDDKEEEVLKLNEKYRVLKMAKSLEGVSNENRDVKLKINEMVREIDKCIALLNK